MATYYTLGASIPELNVDDLKVEYTTEQFVSELKAKAPISDRKLIDIFLLPGDNRLLLALLEEKDLPSSSMPFAIGEKTLREYIAYLKNPDDEELPESPVPSYIKTFIEDFTSGTFHDSPYFLEDILAQRYQEYAMQAGDKFVTYWLDLCQSITAILAAITAKKYDLDRKIYLLGDKPLIEILREGSWSELTTMDEADIITEIMKIGEETNLVQKERRIDAFKWKILDDLLFADVFSIDAMIAYLLKLQILERWILLDRERGLELFREMIMGLKKEGKKELSAFLEKTKKK